MLYWLAFWTILGFLFVAIVPIFSRTFHLFLPNFFSISKLCTTTNAFYLIFLWSYFHLNRGTVVVKHNFYPSLQYIIPFLERLNFFFFFLDNALKQFIVVELLKSMKLLLQWFYIGLKLFVFLSVLKTFSDHSSDLFLDIVSIFEISQKLCVLLVEFEIGIKKFLEDELVVFNEGSQLLFGVVGGLLGVPWVLDFIT